MCNCLDVDLENEKNKYDSKLIWERQKQARAKEERNSERSSYREITNIVNMSQMSNSIRKNKGKRPEDREHHDPRSSQRH